MSEVVYLIATEKNNKRYYLYEIDTDKQRALWTATSRDGLLFHNEKGAQDFIRKYVSRQNSKVKVFVAGVNGNEVSL